MSTAAFIAMGLSILWIICLCKAAARRTPEQTNFPPVIKPTDGGTYNDTARSWLNSNKSN
jgi:hypothetical protein